jgi:hypothetical protein
MSISDTEPDVRTRPITVAAATTRYVESARIHDRKGDNRLSDEFARRHGVHYRPMNITTTVRHYTFKDVILDADTFALLQDGLTIPETVYFLPSHQNDRPEIDPDRVLRLDGSEDIIIGCNKAHDGYQHWLTQCLPAIDWSLRQQRTHGVRLLLPPLASWQEDFLDILGYREIPRLMPEAGKQYFCPHAEYAEFLNGSTAFGICLSTYETTQRILARLPPVPSPHRVLYVPYAKPYYGSIDNAAEVLDLLRRRGVFVVEEGRENTAHRINLFRHADVVIGPHGGGLADILFCKPGTLLWEWMPRNHQNASIDRLAQAAEVDYWGDLLEPVGGPATSRQLHVDVAMVRRRLTELSNRLAIRAVATDVGKASALNASGLRPVASKPIDELMLAFESLGDNCEFGLVQRHGRVEPLGLLRFAGIFLPTEIRLEKLVAALECRFEGLGAPETIRLELAGKPGRQEYMVHESAYDLRYHSGVGESDGGPEELRERETKRLAFLRRKLLDDLRSGSKIWVWKSPSTSRVEQIQPLLRVLRASGRNILLWVVEADQDHPAGTAERLDKDLIKGYVERFAPYDNATDIRPVPWFEVCQATYNLCHPNQHHPAPEETVEALPQRPLSAIEFLAQQPAALRVAPSAPALQRGGRVARMWTWRGFRKR